MAQEETQDLEKTLKQAEETNMQLEQELKALKRKWELLFQSKPEGKRNQLLKVRCTKKTKLAFKAFLVEGSFMTQEDGLSWLLQKYADQAFEKATISVAR